MASFFSNQEIANLFPMPTADSSLDIGMNKGPGYVPQAAQPVSRKPNPAVAAPAMGMGPYAPGTPEFTQQQQDFYAPFPGPLLGNAQAEQPAPPQQLNPLQQFESAMQTGSDYLSRGIGALTSPINTVVGATMKPVGTLMESALSPVNAVLAGIGGSSLGQAGGGFADGVAAYNAAKSPMPEQGMVPPPGVQDLDFSRLSPEVIRQLLEQLNAQLANIPGPASSTAQMPEGGLGGPLQ